MKVEIYSKPQCPFCVQAKALAEREGHELTYKMLDEDFSREDLMESFPTARTFPQIIVDGEKIGGFTEFKALVEASK
jgi:glutaredoxin 3|tara:strand:+ start:107 stop:337 length:231 start_codon:yes stop_codon:yes gene_type:complete